MLAPAHIKRAVPTSLPLLPLAAKWRGQTVALYGGSFNPAHAGHLHVAEQALKRLPVDAVWLLVSPGNPLKVPDPQLGKAQGEMAAFKPRLQSAARIAATHPRIFACDLEARLGTRYSADTIDCLHKYMPHTRFIWIMGADNVKNFHRWRRWHHFARTLPIAIFDRPGYAERAFATRFAQSFAKFRTLPDKLLAKQAPVWTFVSLPRHKASATEIRQEKGLCWHA